MRRYRRRNAWTQLCASPTRRSVRRSSRWSTSKQRYVRCGGSGTPRARGRSRVVVDTGVLVSAYAFGGVPALALKTVLHGSDVYVSRDVLTEYRDVPEQLRRLRKLTAAQRQALVSGIAAFVSEARVVVPTKAVALCRDPADDMLLECCQAARATVLITGDRDLLDLAPKVRTVVGLRRLVILTPRRFLDRALPRGASRD